MWFRSLQSTAFSCLPLSQPSPQGFNLGVSNPGVVFFWLLKLKCVFDPKETAIKKTFLRTPWPLGPYKYVFGAQLAPQNGAKVEVFGYLSCTYVEKAEKAKI